MARTLVAKGNRTTAGTATDATDINSPGSPWTPTPNRLLLVRVVVVNNAAITPTITDTFSGGPLTWTAAPSPFQTQNISGTRTGSGWYWAIVPPSGIGSGVVRFGHSTGNAVGIEVYEEDDFDPVTPIRQSKGANSTTATLDVVLDSAPLTANTVLASVASRNGTADIQPGDNGDPASEISEATWGVGGSIDSQLQGRTGSTSQTIGWKGLNTNNNVGAVIEINAAPAAGDPPDGTPSDLEITVNGATSLTADWTRGSTNNDATSIERAPDSLLTGTVTTDGTPDVVASGGAALTELAIGSFIRIGTLAGEFQVTAITDNDNFAVTPSPSAESGAAYSKAGTWTVLDSALGAAVVTYDDDDPPLSEQTRYWYRVRESNGDGDSDYSNEAWGLTRGKPVVTRVDPTGGSVPLPVFGLGVTKQFEVSATDPDDGALTGASVEWFLDDPTFSTPIGTGVTSPLLDMDNDLGLGAHQLVARATDSDSDTGTAGWNITITELGAGSVQEEDIPMADIPIIYGSGHTERSIIFLDAQGEPTIPTFEAGDVLLRLDNGAFAPATNLPVQVGSTYLFDFTLEPEETEFSEKAKVVFKDQDDPPVFGFRSLNYRTYGDPAATYPETLQVLGSDGKALFSDDIVIDEPAGVPAWGGTFTGMFGWMLAFFKNKRTNDGSAEVVRNEADDADLGTAAISGTTTKSKGAWS